MEKVYKIKHIPTEMFYQPDRGNGNLSITGKIYGKKPNLAHISETMYISESLAKKIIKKFPNLKFATFTLEYGLYETECRREDFKTIEFELHEKSN